MTRKEIEAALPFWQKVLQLDPWSITVRIGKASEMLQCFNGGKKKEPCDGLCYWYPERRIAEITLARRADEEDFVHEMLHIVYQGHLPCPQPYDELFELALNVNAAAMMQLRGPNLTLTQIL